MEEQGSQSSRGLVGLLLHHPSGLKEAAEGRYLRDVLIICVCVCFFSFRHKVSLCSPGWPQTTDSAA